MNCDTLSESLNCGPCGECIVNCQTQHCLDNLNGIDAQNVTIIASAPRCLMESNISAPNSGNLTFLTSGLDVENAFYGMNVISGSNTGDILINCTNTKQCHDLRGL